MEKGNINRSARLILCAYPRQLILAASLFVLVFLTPIPGSSQTLPSGVLSATISTIAPDSSLGSPNSKSTITLMVSSISDKKNAHVSIVDPSDSTLFTQVYDVGRIATYSMSGGYKLTLRFFTALNLVSNTVKVRFEDKSGNFGTAFTVSE